MLETPDNQDFETTWEAKKTSEDVSARLFCEMEKFDSNELMQNSNEVRRLIRKAQSGDINARNKLVIANQWLVKKIAQKYEEFFNWFDKDDLIQEWNFWLIRAIEKFDPDLGYKFSTYAYNWISQSIQRAWENKSAVIRIPSYKNLEVINLKKFYRDFHIQYHRNPTIKEVSEWMNISFKKAKELVWLLEDPRSMEEQVGDQDNKINYGDLFESLQPNPEEKVHNEKLEEFLWEVLWYLTSRQKEIIIKKFLLEENYSTSYLASLYNVSMETIRSEQRKAIQKINKELEKINFDFYEN